MGGARSSPAAWKAAIRREGRIHRPLAPSGLSVHWRSHPSSTAYKLLGAPFRSVFSFRLNSCWDPPIFSGKTNPLPRRCPSRHHGLLSENQDIAAFSLNHLVKSFSRSGDIIIFPAGLRWMRKSITSASKQANDLRRVELPRLFPRCLPTMRLRKLLRLSLPARFGCRGAIPI
jgi:hypothetical protein